MATTPLMPLAPSLGYLSDPRAIVSSSWLTSPTAGSAGGTTHDSPSPSGGSDSSTSQPPIGAADALNLSTDVKPPSTTTTSSPAFDPSALLECVVCADKSSGKHYGQFTCEGCKSFFKRSVRRNLAYACRATKACPIDIHHRNQCQHCRLKKCLRMGMRKEAVQRGRTMESSSVSHLPRTMTAPVATNNHHKAYAAMLFPNACSTPSRPTSGGNSNKRRAVHSPPDARRMPLHVAPRPSLIAQLVLAEPPTPPRCGNPSEMAAQLLFEAVEWSRNVHTTISSMTLDDQMASIGGAWARLFLLNAAQSALPVPDDGDAMTTNNFQTQVDKINALALDSQEFVCLKALVLFDTDTSGVRDRSRIELWQERVTLALDEHCRARPSRFGRLLLRLAALHTLEASGVQALYFTRLVGATPIESIVRDIVRERVAGGVKLELPDRR